MQINSVFKLGLVALLSVVMAACSSTQDDASASLQPSGGEPVPATTRTPGSNNGGLSAAEIAERDEALAQTVFYFEFDRADLSAEDRSALVHHANRLKENPNMRIRLEGHADERGTREYNLALGERRAQAIERYLQVQGVPANQMETISYGEELPADAGSTEAAYSRNRRVELK